MIKFIQKIQKRVKLLRRILQSQKNGKEYTQAASLITYIKEHRIRYYTASRYSKGNYCFMFGADWPKEYDVNYTGGGVFHDEKTDMRYLMHKGKKMYMKRKMPQKDCIGYYKTLLIEQDERSPHKYMSHDIDWKGKVVVDCGAAEGIFALEHIEELRHLYLLEPNEEWIEALQMTFAAYKDKVTIIDKFVGKNDSAEEVSLDYLFKHNIIRSKIDLLKMDIEGAEPDAIQGSMELLKESPGCVLYICEYHDGKHDTQINQLLKEYTCVRRQGLMFPMSLELSVPADELNTPLIRVGVAEFIKKEV